MEGSSTIRGEGGGGTPLLDIALTQRGDHLVVDVVVEVVAELNNISVVDLNGQTVDDLMGAIFQTSDKGIHNRTHVGNGSGVFVLNRNDKGDLPDGTGEINPLPAIRQLGKIKVNLQYS